MTRRLGHVAIVAASLMLLASYAARAQFETPNRSFHNGTSFRLEGKHQTTACEACHINGQFKGTPNSCYDCHWVRRKDDRYQTRLGTQCEQCHRPTSWTNARWDHASQAGVALNGDHRTLACESCHRSATFKAGTVGCVNCHQKDYAATQSPNHTAAGFPTACDACHRPSDNTWRASGTGAFNHNGIFSLVGVHATVTCTACHRNGIYKGTPRDCVGCHKPDYDRTQNPNHAAAGFPLACDGCHRPTDPSFRGAGASGSFNHSAAFPLVGMHATQTCTACHKNNVFKGTPRDCVGCHDADYTRAQNPNHVAAAFPRTCDSCHRASDPAWRGASFNHATFYQLVGVHATQACAACHVNNVYRGTPTTCVGCHQAQYNASRNPSHIAAAFPTTCETCHRPTDASWQQGTFNHTRFPITSGPHNVTCAQCHTTPNNFATFSCTVCHTRAQTDSHHLGQPGYVYESNACYSCHPNGRH